MSKIRFYDKVVIVTGVSSELGRAYALEFAKRGAQIVVNDFGIDNEGRNSTAADTVVTEIKEFGGDAVANYDSIEFSEKIVQTAIDNYDRVDIVINNSGCLRDISLTNMSEGDWKMIYNAHVDSAYKITKAAWPYMKTQGFGRVIFTTSASELGQANYSATKSALLGLGKALAIEGANCNVYSNLITPILEPQLTEVSFTGNNLLPSTSEVLVPLVINLCHENSFENGGVFEVGARWFTKVRNELSQGVVFNIKRSVTAEHIAKRWYDICNFNQSNSAELVNSSFVTLDKMIGLDQLPPKKQSRVKT